MKRGRPTLRRSDEMVIIREVYQRVYPLVDSGNKPLFNGGRTRGKTPPKDGYITVQELLDTVTARLREVDPTAQIFRRTEHFNILSSMKRESKEK